MARVSRREMLKLLGLGSAGVVLAACAPPATSTPTPGAAATGAPPTASGEAVKITLVESWFSVTQDKAILDANNKLVSDKMKSEGLNIEVQSMVLDDHATKYPLLYSSGADFTMAFDAPWNLMDTLRIQGSLAIMDDLFSQHGPNIKSAVTDKILQANTWDGHLYGLPAAGHYGITTGVVLRHDLLEKYGAPEPDPLVGWTSLEPYLQAIADNEPDMVPFAFDANYPPIWEGCLFKRTMGYWQGTNSKTGLIIPDISQGRTLLDFESVPEVVELSQLIRSWWEKGLIPKTDLQSSAGTANLLTDYFFPGKLGALLVNEPNYLYYDYQKTIKSSVPEAVLMGYDMSGIHAGRYKGVGQLKQGNFIVFNASAPQEQLVAAVQFFNWLFSNQENVDLWLLGTDGVNYTKEDNMRYGEVDGVDPATNFRRQWYVGGVSTRFHREPKDLPEEAFAYVQWADTESNFDFDPYESFYVDATVGDLQTQLAQLQAAWAEAFHGLATGQLPTDEAVAKMKQTLDDAGRQEYKAAVQKQLDDFIASR